MSISLKLSKCETLNGLYIDLIPFTNPVILVCLAFSIYKFFLSTFLHFATKCGIADFFILWSAF